MGNQVGSQGLSVAIKNSNLSKEDYEILLKLFRGLAKRSEGPTVDKATFMKFFNYPGVFGERVFALFDQKNTGVIDEEEFMSGLLSYMQADRDGKIDLLFKLYDLTGDNQISVNELQTMLFSVAKIPQLIPGRNTVRIHGNYYDILPKTNEESKQDQTMNKFFRIHCPEDLGDGFITLNCKSDETDKNIKSMALKKITKKFGKDISLINLEDYQLTSESGMQTPRGTQTLALVNNKKKKATKKDFLEEDR